MRRTEKLRNQEKILTLGGWLSICGTFSIGPGGVRSWQACSVTWLGGFGVSSHSTRSGLLIRLLVEWNNQWQDWRGRELAVMHHLTEIWAIGRRKWKRGVGRRSNIDSAFNYLRGEQITKGLVGCAPAIPGQYIAQSSYSNILRNSCILSMYQQAILTTIWNESQDFYNQTVCVLYWLNWWRLKHRLSPWQSISKVKCLEEADRLRICGLSFAE